LIFFREGSDKGSEKGGEEKSWHLSHFDNF
jgi:hypothetical protein